MRIGIIGAGNIGLILARRFRDQGHAVLIANSRGPDTLESVAQQTGAKAVTLAEAADDVDVLVIAIPEKNVADLPKSFLRMLPAGSPIIDTGNYYPPRDGRIDAIDKGMVESEWTSSILGRPVTKAFNNLTADSLKRKGLPKGNSNRIALPIAGDVPAHLSIVRALVESLGFDAYDGGSLAESWRYQPGTPAYCPDPTLDQLPMLLARADRYKAPLNRDSSAKMLGDAVLTFPQPELVRVVRLTSGLERWNPRNWIALLHLLLYVLASKLR